MRGHANVSATAPGAQGWCCGGHNAPPPTCILHSCCCYWEQRHLWLAVPARFIVCLHWRGSRVRLAPVPGRITRTCAPSSACMASHQRACDRITSSGTSQLFLAGSGFIEQYLRAKAGARRPQPGHTGPIFDKHAANMIQACPQLACATTRLHPPATTAFPGPWRTISHHLVVLSIQGAACAISCTQGRRTAPTRPPPLRHQSPWRPRWA